MPVSDIFLFGDADCTDIDHLVAVKPVEGETSSATWSVDDLFYIYKYLFYNCSTYTYSYNKCKK